MARKLHHQGGCIKCGEKRDPETARNGKCDVYFLTDTGTRLKLGLCKLCFDKKDTNPLNLGQIRDSLIESEYKKSLREGKPFLFEWLKSATLVSYETRTDHRGAK